MAHNAGPRHQMHGSCFFLDTKGVPRLLFLFLVFVFFLGGAGCERGSLVVLIEHLQRCPSRQQNTGNRSRESPVVWSRIGGFGFELSCLEHVPFSGTPGQVQRVACYFFNFPSFSSLNQVDFGT